MVGVAQLVEHLVVVQDVAGSSPVTHPGAMHERPKIGASRIVERSSRRFDDLLPVHTHSCHVDLKCPLTAATWAGRWPGLPPGSPVAVPEHPFKEK